MKFLTENLMILSSLTLITVVLIFSMTYYSIVDRKLMADNIQSAIEKSVDPLSVRCSYANSTDNICAIFAAGKK